MMSRNNHTLERGNNGRYNTRLTSRGAAVNEAAR